MTQPQPAFPVPTSQPSATGDPVAEDSPAHRLRFADLLVAAQDASIIIDPCGVVRAWNQAAEQLFERPSAAALGADLAQLIMPPALRDVLRTHLRHAIALATRTPAQPAARSVQ